MTNTRLFAQATKVAIENMKENEQLRTIMFLEGDKKSALFRVEYYVDGQDDYRVLDVRVEVKLLSYKEQLEIADAYGISATGLKIADEVTAFHETMPSPSDEEFETICSLVSDTYFDLDVDFGIYECVKVILSLYNHGYSYNEIWDMSTSERIDTYEELC